MMGIPEKPSARPDQAKKPKTRFRQPPKSVKFTDEESGSCYGGTFWCRESAGPLKELGEYHPARLEQVAHCPRAFSLFWIRNTLMDNPIILLAGTRV